VSRRPWAGLRHSAALAAALSFLLPGLGQALVGRVARGLILALPIVVLLVLAAIVVGAQGLTRLLGEMLQPEVLMALLVLNVGLVVYRLVGIVDAYLLARTPRRGARRAAARRVDERRRVASLSVLGALVAATLGMHLWVGVVTYKTYDLVNNVFAEAPSDESEPTPPPSASPTLNIDGGTPQPTAVPTPTPTAIPAWARDGRLDVLLVGGDAGPGRYSLRTDTMILASVDIATGKAKLFGIPRNLINVPLPGAAAKAFRCGCFPDLLNALYVYASTHPKLFPGDDDVRGYHAVETTIGKLTGVHVDGMVVVDLNGFVRLVDALGGLDINIPAPIYDPKYPLENGRGYIRLSIKAGKQHLDGHLALAYARSRHQDDDYHRMQRQQRVLLALRKQLSPCSLVPRLPELLDIAKDSLWTDLPLRDLPDLLAVMHEVDTKKIAQASFAPPYIAEYITPLALQRIRTMVANAFVDDPKATPPPASVPDSLPSC
jgi:LCP family protein required for cell wall assembly